METDFISCKRVDLTGNWHRGEGFPDRIQVAEPPLRTGETATFRQSLDLPPGRYRVQIVYDPSRDKAPGHALGYSVERFDGLSIGGETGVLCFRPEDGAGTLTAGRDVVVEHPGRSLDLALVLGNTRVPRTWLIADSGLPVRPCTHAVPPPTGTGEWVMVRNLPFLIRETVTYQSETGTLADLRAVDHGSLVPCTPEAMLPLPDVAVRRMHCLGMVHNIDIANGSWFSPKGDHGYSHFVGDRAGDLVISYCDGSEDIVPLVFGFNLWYGRPWDLLWHYNWAHADCEGAPNRETDRLFGGDRRPREAIRAACRLVDGVRLMGSDCVNTRFVFSLDLEGRCIRRLRIRGDAGMHGYPLISGITLETSEPAAGLPGLPSVSARAPAVHTVGLDCIHREQWRPDVERLKRALYTFVDDAPRLDDPEIPGGYFGPGYDFRGTQEAVYAATYLYRNGPECASHVADSGVTCSSPVSSGTIGHYTAGMGAWWFNAPHFGSLANWFRLYREREPGQLPGRNSAWTRGAGELLREAVALGYDKFADSYVAWLDRALFAESNPPHWNRVAGEPEVATYRVRVGEVEERGNRENDGHGICMWGRYLVYHAGGRSATWNRDHWPATRAAVEWIQWQLDTDLARPGVRKDVLYTESECAHEGYDFYSSYNCLHGIGLALRMGWQLGEADTVRRWQRLCDRLRRGILRHLVDDTAFGPVWHTEENCEWQDHAHKLAHLQLAPDGHTFTPLEDYAASDELEQRYLEIDANSYRFLMRERDYNCLRMYGYGQGMMTQAALLLDRMNDAEHFINAMVRHAWLPRLAGWASAEGVILHRSGAYYLPVNGYEGQDGHVAESTKALRLMLGVDDNSPDHLRLVPRYPATWSRAWVRDIPVLVGKCRSRLAYTYDRQPDHHRFLFSADVPLEHLSVRLGPIPDTRMPAAVRLDGVNTAFETLESGDSRWVWIRDLVPGPAGELVVEFRASRC